VDNENKLILEREVKEIKAALSGLNNRLLMVEKYLYAPGKDVVEQPKTTLVQLHKEVAEQPPTNLVQSHKEFKSGADQANSKPFSEFIDKVKVSEVPEQNLETRIGEYWLNKLGVVSLVLGVVFLILYSFQYFGAPLKLLTGTMVSAVLIFFGEKIARSEQNKWYGHSLMGGGWALAYFVVYAMYFVPDLKMIDSYPLEFGLLICVCAAALLHAIYRRAETIGILAVTLANLSIGLSGPSMMSNIPILLIAIMGSLVALRNNWYGLFIWLVVASYIGHGFASGDAYSYTSSTRLETGWSACVFLSALWLIINVALFFAKEDTAWQRGVSVAVSCLNALAFGMCMLVLANDYCLQQRSWIFGGAGALYLWFAWALGFCQLKSLKITGILIGLSFVNASIWMKFTGAPVAVFNLFEIGLLAVLGLRFDIKAFRWFALYLSFCLFPLWLPLWAKGWFGAAGSSNKFIFIGILATIVFAVVCWFYRKEKYLHVQGTFEKIAYKQIYFCLANFSAWLTPFALDDVMSAVVLWCLQPITCTIFCIESGELFYGNVALLQAIFACLSLVFTISNWQWAPAIFIVIACFSFYVYARQRATIIKNAYTGVAQKFSVILGSSFLTLFFLQKLSSFWLSTGFALEGLVLVSVGFVLKDRLFRIPGLLVLALLTLKLLFVDLANADTLQRIVSFIAAGAVFLAASYAYTKFAGKFGGTE